MRATSAPCPMSLKALPYPRRRRWTSRGKKAKSRPLAACSRSRARSDRIDDKPSNDAICAPAPFPFHHKKQNQHPVVCVEPTTAWELSHCGHFLEKTAAAFPLALQSRACLVAVVNPKQYSSICVLYFFYMNYMQRTVVPFGLTT